MATLWGLGIAAIAAVLAGAWWLHAHGVGAGQGVVAAGAAALDPLAVPPDRPARIVVLGTSLTNGGTWTDDLAAALAACHPGGVAVARTARNGATSRWGVGQIDAVLATSPDLLIIEFAINDASLARGMTLAAFRARHAAMLAAAARAGVPVALATMNPAWGFNAWAERPGLAAYHAHYRSLAAAGQAGLIDSAPAWAALSPERLRTWMPDGLHPTEAGQREVTVPVFAAALRAALCPAP